MIEEVRWYQARPGRRDDLVALMDEHVIPFMAAHGMTVVGSYLDVDDDAGYVWIRRFDSEAHRAAATTAAYGDARWTEDLHGRVLQVMEPAHAVVTTIRPTRPSAP